MNKSKKDSESKGIIFRLIKRDANEKQPKVGLTHFLIFDQNEDHTNANYITRSWLVDGNMFI